MVDDSIRRYKWIDTIIFDHDIMCIPKWLLNAVINKRDVPTNHLVNSTITFQHSAVGGHTQTRAIQPETSNSNNSIDGYVYILYNEVFQHYGDNVFKIGRAKDVISRLNGYTTSYIRPCELKFVSNICKNITQAEQLIFTGLNSYRITKDR